MPMCPGCHITLQFEHQPEEKVMQEMRAHVINALYRIEPFGDYGRHYRRVRTCGQCEGYIPRGDRRSFDYSTIDCSHNKSCLRWKHLENSAKELLEKGSVDTSHSFNPGAFNLTALANAFPHLKFSSECIPHEQWCNSSIARCQYSNGVLQKRLIGRYVLQWTEECAQTPQNKDNTHDDDSNEDDDDDDDDNEEEEEDNEAKK